jgi:phage-related protein (TIGR01555 family)
VSLPIWDKLINLVTGLGTAKDKGAATGYDVPVIDMAQLCNAFRGDWLSQKVVQIPAQDATREWRNWVADEKQITAIEALEIALGLQAKVEEALIKARLVGGAGIYMGVEGAGEPAEELVLARVRTGSLKYIYVMERQELSPGPLVYDIASKYFGQPAYYQFTPQGSAGMQIHPSRVVLLIPQPVPLRSMRDSCWGDPILLAKQSALMNASVVGEATANLVHEATLDIFKVPDLLNNVGDKEWRSLIQQRFQLAQLTKSTINALIMDKTEEYERKETNFAGIPDTIAQQLNIAAGAADIPLTRLLGSSPGGLNATGDSDLRNYYDSIGAWQKVKLGPCLAPLDAVLLASAVGDAAGIYYEWRPLWQLKPTEKATNLSTKATAVSAIYNTGLVPDEVLAPAVINMLIEDGQLPGLEKAHKEYLETAATDDPPDENNPQVQDQWKRLRALRDGKAKTLYVSRKVLNPDDLVAWAKGQGIDLVDDPHVTITYSRTPVDWMLMGEAWGSELKVAAGGPRDLALYGPTNDTLVLEFNCSDLRWRHDHMVAQGASWDWDNYQPHITLATGVAIDPDTLAPYTGELVLGPEIFEQVG